MRFWRLSTFRERDRTFNGEGARLYPGRWTPPKVRVVYSSETISLATLEILVHADREELPSRYYGFPIDIPDRLVEHLNPRHLPAGWNTSRGRSRTRSYGGTWATSLRSVALVVPSAIVPSEHNAILNPIHPDFRKLTIHPPVPILLDKRLHPGARRK